MVVQSRVNPFSIMLVFIFILLITSTTTFAQIKIGNGQSEAFGYKFDGPVERGLWRAGHYVGSLGKVTDCNSLCIHSHGRRGGNCVPCSGYCDRSTWCPAGQSCRCF